MFSWFFNFYNRNKRAVAKAPKFLFHPKSPAHFKGPPGDEAFHEIKSRANPKKFPLEIVGDCASAASFFCAAFQGFNDVVHLHRKGFSELLLIDLDGEKLDAMRDIYRGEEVRFEQGDAFEVAHRLRKEKRKFDLVITDPWSNIMRRTAVDDLPLFTGLASKWYLSGLTGVDFEQMGIKPNVAAFNGWLAANGRGAYRIDRLILRNPAHQNGIYWVVFPVSKKAGAASEERAN